MNGFIGTRLSRRHVLRAAGAAVTLPFFDAMLPRAWARPSTFESLPKSEAVQPRMLCCYVPNGVNIIDWVPADSGENYTPVSYTHLTLPTIYSV